MTSCLATLETQKYSSRIVLCPFGDCKNSVSIEKLKEHFKKKHVEPTSIGITVLDATINLYKYECKAEDSSYKYSYLNAQNWLSLRWIITSDSKYFFVQRRDINGYSMVWLQLFGSKFEAKNYHYSVKISDPKIGVGFCYRGPMKSLEDDKNEIFGKGLGLSVKHGIMKKLACEGFHSFVIKITRNFKPKEDEIDSEHRF